MSDVLSASSDKRLSKSTQKHLPVESQPRNTNIEKAPIAIGLPVFFITIALMAYGALQTYQWLQDEQKLPVQEVVFSGNMQVLQSAALEKLIRTRLTGSFFALDVNDVHDLMEAQAWVYSASVRKRWPSKLYVHIVEQKAVARWNDDLLLNKYGNSFEGLTTVTNANQQLHQQLISNLPQLFGPGGSEKTALTGYTHMQGLLSATQQRISELVLSERFAWQVKLNSDVVLNMGRQDYINRLQRFIDVYPLMRQKSEQDNTQIDYVDLRYDTGLAVGWKTGLSSSFQTNANTMQYSNNNINKNKNKNKKAVTSRV